MNSSGLLSSCLFTLPSGKILAKFVHLKSVVAAIEKSAFISGTAVANKSTAVFVRQARSRTFRRSIIFCCSCCRCRCGFSCAAAADDGTLSRCHHRGSDGCNNNRLVPNAWSLYRGRLSFVGWDDPRRHFVAIRAAGSIEVAEIFQQEQRCSTDQAQGNQDWNSHENDLSKSLLRRKSGIIVVKVSHVVGVKGFFLRQLHGSCSDARLSLHGSVRSNHDAINYS